jgi:hypothetical protein
MDKQAYCVYRQILVHSLAGLFKKLMNVIFSLNLHTWKKSVDGKAKEGK